MLKKLLKYDLKSVFKYWWIAAIASLGVSVMGGISFAILDSEKDIPSSYSLLAGIGIFIAIMGLCAFLIVSIVLIFVRFQKNFFTDEGYLTFTLPVKRSELLNSKLIMSVVTNFAAGTIFIIDIIIMVSIGFGKQIYTPEIWQDVVSAFNELATLIDGPMIFYIIVYVIEFLILVLLSCVFSTLFLFGCITFSSIIAKKAKVITAIGVYYLANSLFSGVFQTVYLFGASALDTWLSSLPQNMYAPLIALILLVIILMFALVCALLYWLMYWLLDRKLNLS